MKPITSRVWSFVFFYGLLFAFVLVAHSGPVAELGLAGEDTSSSSDAASGSSASTAEATAHPSGSPSSSAVSSLVGGSSTQPGESGTSGSAITESSTAEADPTVASLQQADPFTDPNFPTSNTNNGDQQIVTENADQTAGAFQPSSLSVKKIVISNPTLTTDPDTGAALKVNGK
jgi:hypothetical protein